MITPQKHLINTRALTTHFTVQEELDINPSRNYLFDLSYLGVLELQGDKALDYLQGQVTCDLRQLTERAFCQGALCNLKGRILGLMDIIQWTGIKLILPVDMMEATQSSLAKTAQLSRIRLSPNQNFKLFGFYLNNPDDIVPVIADLPDTLHAQISTEDWCCYHLGFGFYIFLVSPGMQALFSEPFIEKNQFLGSLTWHTLQLQKSRLEIYPESRGLFLPHRLHLHQTSYIAFNKGCYKGQEIIARMHYKGTLKHDFKCFKIRTAEALFSGQLLKKMSDNTELGELIDFSKVSSQEYVVALSLLKNAPSQVLFEGHTEAVTLVDLSSIA